MFVKALKDNMVFPKATYLQDYMVKKEGARAPEARGLSLLICSDLSGAAKGLPRWPESFVII